MCVISDITPSKEFVFSGTCILPDSTVDDYFENKATYDNKAFQVTFFTYSIRWWFTFK